MKLRHSVEVLLLVLVAAPCFPARADIVRLQSGKTLEGRIEEQTAQSIRLRMHRGTFVFPAHGATATHEDDAVDYYRLALQAQQAGELNEAFEWLTRSTESDPAYAEASRMRAAVDLEMKRQEIAPALDEIHRLARARDFRAAIRRADDLLARYGSDVIGGEVAAEAATLLADYAWHLYDRFAVEPAMEALKRARLIGGEGHPAIHYTLARIAEMDQNFESALDEYELAVERMAAWRDAQSRLADIRARREQAPPKAPVAAVGSLDELIRAAAARHGLSASFVNRVILLESSRRADARSEADARGLMQVRRPAWDDMAARLGVDWNFDEKAYSPEHNIEIGCAYLAWLRDVWFPKYPADIEGVDEAELLLQGYHAGPARTIYYKGNVPGSRTRAYLARYRDMVGNRVGQI